MHRLLPFQRFCQIGFCWSRLQDSRVGMGRCGGSGVGMKLASGGRFRIEPWLAEGLIPASPRTQPDQEPGVQATRGPQPRTSDWSPIWSTTLTSPPINKFKTKDGGARYVPQIILTIITSLEPAPSLLTPVSLHVLRNTPSTLSSKSAARGGSETAARTNVKTCPS